MFQTNKDRKKKDFALHIPAVVNEQIHIYMEQLKEQGDYLTRGRIRNKKPGFVSQEEEER